MSGFTGPLRLEHMNAQWRLWTLLEPLVWEADYKGSQREIVVPQGFTTDGATVPRFLWSVFPPMGGYLRAACLHDMLCRLCREGTPHQYAPTRKDADIQFRKAMHAIGTPAVTRFVLYCGVRLFAILAGRDK